MATEQQGPTPEFALAYRDIMLMGLTNELQATKKVLAAIPDAKRDYKPDPNSRTAGDLAWHLASADVQMLDETADRKFAMEARFKDEPKTTAELVSWYEQNYLRAIDRVRAMSPEELLTPVDFYGAFTLPVVFYLGFVNNHSIHHRGQLATYLRPMGSKCPSIYGGSHDEPWQGVPAESNAA
jgi:uncharacterized damage-inducible protein DinB